MYQRLLDRSGHIILNVSLLHCLSSSCAQRFGMLNLLPYVPFEFLLSIATQFALALDFLTELKNLRSYGVMTA